jgi:hypothetical protein
MAQKMGSVLNIMISPCLAAGYEGGRKCSQAVPLHSSTNFNSYSSKVLKQMVKDHGIECIGAMEKADFVLCLTKYVKSASKEHMQDEL